MSPLDPHWAAETWLRPALAAARRDRHALAAAAPCLEAFVRCGSEQPPHDAAAFDARRLVQPTAPPAPAGVLCAASEALRTALVRARRLPSAKQREFLRRRSATA